MTHRSNSRRRATAHILLSLATFALLLVNLSSRSLAATRSEAELHALAAEYQGYIDYLADPKREGRGPGTEGIEQARDYLIAKYKSFGLKPAFKGKYTQGFQIKLGVKAAEQSLSVTGPDGKDAQAIKPETDFSALGFSASKAFEGEAVFVGYAAKNDEKKYDSFAGDKDALKGKVAIAYRFEPQNDKGASQWVDGDRKGQWSGHANLTEKAKQAAAHGAVALLLVNPPSQEDGVLRSTMRTAFGEDAEIPVIHIRASVFAQLLKRAGRAGDDVAKSLQADADAGKDKPDALKGVVIKGEVKLDRPSAMIENVACVLPGRGPLAKEYVFVGAHYDHIGYGEIGSRATDEKSQIHPGADDNGSGTAGLVMLAERFAKEQEKDDADAAPRRTIVFASFSGEERGLLGSKYMVTHLDEMGIDAKDIAAMVNMDMIGRLRPTHELFVFGVGSGDGLKPLIEKLCEGTDFKLNTSGSAMGASDHASFYMQKVPALHFFTGSHKDYHMPTDTAETINSEGAVRVLEIVDATVRALATRQDRLAFVAEAASPHAGGAAFPAGGAYLGILPDYATVDGDQGCGLDGVSPGGPAAAAGLKGGDVIVGWDGKKLNNIRHMMEIISQQKGGDEVMLKIKRGDKTLDIKVKLGTR